MKKNYIKILFVVVLVALSIIFPTVQAGKTQFVDTDRLKTPGEHKVHPYILPDNRGTVKPVLDFGRLPLYFITNEGQVNKKAEFYARASRYTLWLTKEGLVFDSSHASKPVRDVSRLVFLNANRAPGIIPVEETKHRVNYFKGNDKSKWHGDIPTSKAVLYKCLYKNIDLKVYGIEKRIEYDWIVKTGGNPGNIRFRYENVTGTRIDENGNLLIGTNHGELIHKRPFSYQEGSMGERTVVDVTFKKIGENTYGFEVGEYDGSRELIIDPVVLAYSTYLGGNDHFWDTAAGITLDAGGYVYVTGGTYSDDFPTLNQYQSNQDAGWMDVFVTKLDMNQSGAASLVYSTYIGGGHEEGAAEIAVDNSGGAYVVGTTMSTDYPVFNELRPFPGGLQNIFVSKLDTTVSGTASLVYSTYLGAGFGNGIAVDADGYAYATGRTTDPNFPILNQYMGYYSAYSAFVIKLDTTQSGAASLLYSTYLGGTSAESGSAIAAAGGGIVYVAGETQSADFPTLNPYQGYRGEQDVFVAKIDTTLIGLSSLLYSTSFGGVEREYCRAMTVDGEGNVYVGGFTSSTDFPGIRQYQSDQPREDGFVTKLDTSQGGPAVLVYSTYLGGNEHDHIEGIAVDTGGYVWVTGDTESSDFPTLNPYGAIPGLRDVFVSKIDTTRSGAAGLVFSTYLGGSDEDGGVGITVDAGGNVYVTGYTESPDFPTVNQYQSDQANCDAFVTKLIVPPMALIAPNGGESWNHGSTQTITWNAGGISGDLKITLYKNGAFLGRIADNLDPASGSYTWTVGEHSGGTAPGGTGYTVKIKEKGTTVSDVSDTSFSIARLTVTSPNGGENLQIGSTGTITWNAGGLSGNVKITLYKDGVLLGRIADNLDPASGSFTWTVGEHSGGTAPAGTGYTVKIKEKGTTVSDVSDVSFTLTD